jgi:hypothetical protein
MESVSVLRHHLAVHILILFPIAQKKERNERKWYGTLPVLSPIEATATNPECHALQM